MQKSLPQKGAPANWYRGLSTRQQGEYYGSLSSLYPNEVFVTFDGKWIVTRTADGDVSVVQNVCLHAGMRILNKVGTQHKKNAEIRCSGHQWLYDPKGNLLAAPKFCKFEGRLACPKFSIWNGFNLGYSKEEISALDSFGETLGLPKNFLSVDQFWFGREVEYALPYPRALMAINYLDGLHVPRYHETTFGPVVSEECYEWEFGPTDTSCSYSIQLVRVRPDVRAHVDRLMRMREMEQSDLGWADFHFWLEEVMPDVKTPINKDIFAVWTLIYGDANIMPELYEGGRFLALSYLVATEDADGKVVNRNYVEFYVHHSVPEKYRAEALEKFIFAYEQSAREDDELCIKLWAAHQRNDIVAPRIVHETLERGDAHHRDWYLKHFKE